MEVMIMKNIAANADLRILCSIPKLSGDYYLDCCCCPMARSITATTTPKRPANGEAFGP